ncbi:MAG: hypothetical protein CML29_03565 [Rhizobiales bacterium]|nr:hypothetical protein [Hyphomicrobiales bacterium]MBA67757.1 hypothetical protein [Hyphomicrobiales bacterium]|tara:strand:- start:154 stop:348 length:195 start_codon:yes stop_codon:yes gene_type:complete
MIVFAGLTRIGSNLLRRIQRSRLNRAMEALSPETRKDIGWPAPDDWNDKPARLRDEMRLGGRTN